jgi:hypothetical protein
MTNASRLPGIAMARSEVFGKRLSGGLAMRELRADTESTEAENGAMNCVIR